MNESPSSAAATIAEKAKVVMLFGVCLNPGIQTGECIRKSASTGNLVCPSQCPQDSSEFFLPAFAHGYVSDGMTQAAIGLRERKKGVPWSEDEHKRFLAGLQKLGKGDWKGISRKFVPTRTPTQVASHAQKYFIRQNNLSNKRKRGSSLLDMSADLISPVTVANGMVATSEKRSIECRELVRLPRAKAATFSVLWNDSRHPEFPHFFLPAKGDVLLDGVNSTHTPCPAIQVTENIGPPSPSFIAASSKESGLLSIKQVKQQQQQQQQPAPAVWRSSVNSATCAIRVG